MSIIGDITKYLLAGERHLTQNLLSTLRRILAASSIVLLSIALLVGSIFLFLAALFFSLAHLANYVYPALASGGISFLLSVIVAYLGLSMLRQR